MMSLPLVSIIIPIYNHEKFLEKALLSIINQSYKKIEIIAIDDGSTDKSAELAKSLLSNSDVPHVFLTRENRGAHNTINEGVKLSRGNYVTVLNSDDFYHLERISECVSTALMHKSDFVITDVEYVDEFGLNVEGDPYIEGIKKSVQSYVNYPSKSFALLKTNIGISTGNYFFSRYIYENVGGFESYKYVHDWDFILKCMYYVEPVLISKKLYFYRVHGTNSFKSLADVEAYETTEVMRNCMHRLVKRTPENKLAPSPHNWPIYFDYFIDAWNYHVYMPQS
ncbi:glycosyltransferase [Asticcacaulis excentricus]|uniref:glycosyltransferase n=1 Tax=Asticcacaulis excentricus TaxID=78587 RepID=UPI000F84AD04|nr:glycosyltransferase [Asticcacaulis excentricus]